MKRKVGSNRDQLTPFSALLDPPDSSETYSSITKKLRARRYSSCHYWAFVNAAIMAYQFAASQPQLQVETKKEIERSYDDEYPTTARPRNRETH